MEITNFYNYGTMNEVKPGATQINNYYGCNQPETQGEQQTAAAENGTVDEKLTSEEAKVYWQRLQEAGFVDANYQLLPETTRKQAMYIAEIFAEKLGINSKWKTFERLWGISNLAQEKWDFQQTGTMPARSKDIDKIFED